MLDMSVKALYAVSTAADATITLDSPIGQRWSIGGIAWSYEGGTLSTDAELTIWATASGVLSNIIFSIDINDDGAGFIIPSEPIKFPPNLAIVFDLTSGGVGVVGKLNILGAKRV